MKKEEGKVEEVEEAEEYQPESLKVAEHLKESSAALNDKKVRVIRSPGGFVRVIDADGNEAQMSEAVFAKKYKVL